MKKFLLLTCLVIATPAIALPSLRNAYDGAGTIINLKPAKVYGYEGTGISCSFDDGKLIQKSSKSFEIKFGGYEGTQCEPDITTLKGSVLEIKNNKVTKFKIEGKNFFSGVYTLSYNQ